MLSLKCHSCNLKNIGANDQLNLNIVCKRKVMISLSVSSHPCFCCLSTPSVAHLNGLVTLDGLAACPAAPRNSLLVNTHPKPSNARHDSQFAVMAPPQTSCSRADALSAGAAMQPAGRPRRRLVLTVRAAADLSPTALKPYVLIEFGDSTLKTDVARVAGENPVSQRRGW